ncbi:MAG TPA: hypothetical protein P5307_12010, partial [Pirellulaceae bacterium]|nr:hypothetical protein [Pirellulaceae bacterium]
TEGAGTLADPYDEIDQALLDARFRINLPVDSAAEIKPGETFVLDDGTHPAVTFTFTNTTGVSGRNIGIASAASASDVADLIVAAINGQPAGTLDFTATKIVSGTRIRVDVTALNPGFATLDLGGTKALLAAPNLVRIVGNGNVPDFPGNARPYLVGLDDVGNALEDGSTFDVPRGATVMIDEGVLFKLQDAIIDVGSSTGTIDRRGAALQILGVPESSVYFRSYHNDTIGGDSDAVGAPPVPGDWGGIVFRNDSDFEGEGIFLNWVNHADMNNGGGKVVVGSLEEVFTPIHIETARPTVSFNRITNSADAAISANPNSFEDTLNRIGPDIQRNTLITNSINGLFVRIETNSGVPVEKLEVPVRFDDDDIVHVIIENLQIAGSPGGPVVTNEVQLVDFTGTPRVGVQTSAGYIPGETFTLAFNGEVTKPIEVTAPANINTNEVQRLEVRGGTATKGLFDLFVNSENQTITVPNTATSGSFSLRFHDPVGRVGVSSPIRFNATATDVLQAIESMPHIQPGDIVVAGSFPGSMTIGFRGQLLGLDVDPFTILSNSLSDGTSSVAASVQDDASVSSAAAALDLPYNATANQVRGALEGLFSTSVIAPGDISVTGGPLPNPIDVSFRGKYAGRNIVGMTIVNDFGNPVSNATTTLNPTVIDDYTPVIYSVRHRLEELVGIANPERGEITTLHTPPDIRLSGGPLPASPVSIEFVGQYTGRDVSLLEVDGVSATANDDTATSTTTLSSGASITTDVMTSSAISARPAARLQVDAGLILKLEGSRIEGERGTSQFIAEGTSERPIVFTSRSDDSYGASGTFDLTGDGVTVGTPGDWGGLIFNAGASVSIDHGLITFAGGRIPIEGDFDQFNALEVHQADLRLTNSILENNSSGLASSGRNGRGTNTEAVIFVRGAQPIIVDNIFRDNLAHDNSLAPIGYSQVGTHIISINANSLTSSVQGDYGRTTGELN